MPSPCMGLPQLLIQRLFYAPYGQWEVTETGQMDGNRPFLPGNMRMDRRGPVQFAAFFLRQGFIPLWLPRYRKDG